MARNFTENTTTESSLDNPRVRFNWGFHDATHDAEQNWTDRRTIKAGERDRTGRAGLDRTTPLGKAYAMGYDAGQKAMVNTKTRPDSSEPAWRAYINQPVPGLTE